MNMKPKSIVFRRMGTSENVWESPGGKILVRCLETWHLKSTAFIGGTENFKFDSESELRAYFKQRGIRITIKN